MVFETKNRVNKRRLTIKQVNEIIDNGAQLHEELTEVFKTLNVEELGKPEIFNHDGNLLYVHANLVEGKGDVYSRESFEKILAKYRRMARLKKKIENRLRGHSHPVKWSVYSELGSEMIHHLDELKMTLVKYLDVSVEVLDGSYKSLDLLSDKVNQGDPYDELSRMYDAIFVYVGEVLIKKTGGNWKLDEYEQIPYVDIGHKRVRYNPLNVIGHEITSTSKVDFRRQTANEIRSHAKYLKCFPKKSF